MAIDKLTPLAAPPGHSLTGPKGKWPWDRPPRFSNPDEAIDFVTEKLDTPQSKDGLLKLMLAGITIEEIVSQVAFKGFASGTFNPDVAELIKPAIAVYLMGIADEKGLNPQLFVDESEEEQVDDVTFFKILKQRNPELFDAMNEEMNENQRMQEQKAIENSMPPEPAPPSFLNTQSEGA